MFQYSQLYEFTIFYNVSKYLIKMNMPYKLKNIYISYKYNVEEIVSVFQQEEEYHVTQ